MFGGDGGAPLDDAAAVLLGALPPPERAALGRQVDAAAAAAGAAALDAALECAPLSPATPAQAVMRRRLSVATTTPRAARIVRG